VPAEQDPVQDAIIKDLYEARRNGTPPSCIDQIPSELDEVLALQLRILNRFETEGERLGGWKVGLTSGEARDRMGKDFRPFGYVLQSRIFRSGVTFPVGPIMNCHIEPELCLTIGSPLRGPEVDREQAKTAVRAVAPAFEINEIRVQPDKGHAPLLADGLSQWGIVVGPEVPVRERLVETTVEFSCDGQVVKTKTPGTTMDDPYLSLSRLCRLLDKFGLGLEPGQPVITGSFCRHAVTQAGIYTADFSDIGAVSVRFS
jgi:2-keto-4-pentenoate hydratase